VRDTKIMQVDFEKQLVEEVADVQKQFARVV
jgi:hypothetical protein